MDEILSQVAEGKVATPLALALSAAGVVAGYLLKPAGDIAVEWVKHHFVEEDQAAARQREVLLELQDRMSRLLKTAQTGKRYEPDQLTWRQSLFSDVDKLSPQVTDPDLRRRISVFRATAAAACGEEPISAQTRSSLETGFAAANDQLARVLQAL